MKFILKVFCIEKQKLYRLLTAVIVVGLGNICFINAANACTPFRQNLSAPASINLDPSAAIGSVVASTSLSWPGFAGDSDCLIPYGISSGVFTLVGEGTVSGNLYPTNIPGLSYRGRITSVWPSTFFNYWPISVTQVVSNIPGVASGSVLVEFVKTGPIGTGVFGPQIVMHASIQGVPWFELFLATPITIKPSISACTVTQSAITVNLDDTTTSQLKIVGNTSKDKAFNIPINCTSASNIALAFSGNVADYTNAVFSNLSGSTNSSSVGVQILKDGSSVPVIAGNYLNLGQIQGATTVALTARYYALDNNADVGAVSAIAYATIVYN